MRFSNRQKVCFVNVDLRHSTRGYWHGGGNVSDKSGKHAIFSKTDYKYMYVYREGCAVYVFHRLPIANTEKGMKKKSKQKLLKK